MTGINEAGRRGWHGLIALHCNPVELHIYISVTISLSWSVFVFISQKRQRGSDLVIQALLHFQEDTAQSSTVNTSGLPLVALSPLSIETQSEIRSAVKTAYVRIGRGCKFLGTCRIFPSIK